MQAVPQDQNKITKGYDKSHKAKHGIKLLELIGSVVCDVKAHMQGTWATMKAKKCLYTFFQRRNTTNEKYMKAFEAYIKVIDY